MINQNGNHTAYSRTSRRLDDGVLAWVRLATRATRRHWRRNKKRRSH